MLINLLWLLAGGAIATILLRFFRPTRDYYLVETCAIISELGDSLSDLSSIEIDRSLIDMSFNIIRGGRNWTIKHKGKKEFFAQKSFEIFDDYAAAQVIFNKTNELLLGGFAPDGWTAHRVYLWTVTARSRGGVMARISNDAYGIRKLDETNYSALLKKYVRRSKIADSI